MIKDGKIVFLLVLDDLAFLGRLLGMLVNKISIVIFLHSGHNNRHVTLFD